MNVRTILFVGSVTQFGEPWLETIRATLRRSASATGREHGTGHRRARAGRGHPGKRRRSCWPGNWGWHSTAGSPPVFDRQSSSLPSP
ncbi:MAG: hypothetical protein R3A10_13145 [Caldilineaceae bacterium]